MKFKFLLKSKIPLRSILNMGTSGLDFCFSLLDNKLQNFVQYPTEILIDYTHLMIGQCKLTSTCSQNEKVKTSTSIYFQFTQAQFSILDMQLDNKVLTYAYRRKANL